MDAGENNRLGGLAAVRAVGKRCWGGHEAGREAGARPDAGRWEGAWLRLNEKACSVPNPVMSAGSQRGDTAAQPQRAATHGAVGVASEGMQRYCGRAASNQRGYWGTAARGQMAWSRCWWSVVVRERLPFGAINTQLRLPKLRRGRATLFAAALIGWWRA
jgi:hypothetical protein